MDEREPIPVDSCSEQAVERELVRVRVRNRERHYVTLDSRRELRRLRGERNRARRAGNSQLATQLEEAITEGQSLLSAFRTEGQSLLSASRTTSGTRARSVFRAQVGLRCPTHRAQSRTRRSRPPKSRKSSNARRSDDPDGEEPGDGRRCACGCGASLDGRRRNCRFVNSDHQKRHDRRRQVVEEARGQALAGTVNWLLTLRAAAEIRDVRIAISSGRVPAVAGERLIAALAASRLHTLRRGRPARVSAGAIVFGDCLHRTVIPDIEGDAVCAHCGQLADEVSTSSNGYDATASLMAANGHDADSATRDPEWARYAGTTR
jgi:hypothetical protein